MYIGSNFDKVISLKTKWHIWWALIMIYEYWIIYVFSFNVKILSFEYTAKRAVIHFLYWRGVLQWKNVISDIVQVTINGNVLKLNNTFEIQSFEIFVMNDWVEPMLYNTCLSFFFLFYITRGRIIIILFCFNP